MGSLNRQRGKAHQKKTAQLLGGVNVGTLGGEDVLTDEYSVECKSTKAFVGAKWFKQCDDNNTRKKIPLVIVHVRGTRYTEDLVIIRMKDFLGLQKGE